MNNTPITVAYGDGIGPEIMDATLRIIQAAGARIDVETIEVGEKVAFYPSHVCTCVNLSDELVGVRDGRVERVWAISARGFA